MHSFFTIRYIHFTFKFVVVYKNKTEQEIKLTTWFRAMEYLFTATTFSDGGSGGNSSNSGNTSVPVEGNVVNGGGVINNGTTLATNCKWLCFYLFFTKHKNTKKTFLKY